MRLYNYWWLLIWPFLFGAVSTIFITRRREIVFGRRVMRWRWLPALIMAAPYAVWAAGRSDHYGDTRIYRIAFSNMPTGLTGMFSYVSSRSKGKLFVFVEYLFKTFISDSSVAFFFLVALIQLFFLVWMYRKYSRDYWLSMFLFIASTDYLSWMHNGIRQFVAVTFIFFCVPLLASRKYILMCLAVLAAVLIHSSAIIFLPFVFIVNGRAWNRRTILFIFAVIIAVLFINQVSGFLVGAMEDTSYEGDIEIFLNDDGTNIIRVLFYAVPTLMAWIYRPYIDRADDPMINICVNLSIISTGVYVFSYFTSGVLVGALPIYFSLGNYILIPWLLSEVFNHTVKNLLTIIFVAVYSFFFYYQCGPTWHLL